MTAVIPDFSNQRCLLNFSQYQMRVKGSHNIAIARESLEKYFSNVQLEKMYPGFCDRLLVGTTLGLSDEELARYLTNTANMSNNNNDSYLPADISV